MSNRTWVCLECRRSYRRDQSVRAVTCARCARPCEYVHWKLHIPSPGKRKAWDEFWTQYLFEKREIRRFEEDETVGTITLPLLNQQWLRQPRRSGKAAAQRRRR